MRPPRCRPIGRSGGEATLAPGWLSGSASAAAAVMPPAEKEAQAARGFSASDQAAFLFYPFGVFWGVFLSRPHVASMVAVVETRTTNILGWFSYFRRGCLCFLFFCFFGKQVEKKKEKKEALAGLVKL